MQRCPDVSVIVPAFNTAAYIERCLSSIAGQTLSSFEVIVVDDGSTDDTGQIARRFAQLDPRFKIVRHQANRGLPAARNTGMTFAAGRYLYHVDSDDFLSPDALETLVRTADEGDADIVLAHARYYVEDSNLTLSRIFRIQYGGHGLNYNDEPAFWSGGNIFLALFRREFVERNAILFDEAVSLGEDQIFMAKALPSAERISSVTKVVYYYRRGHPCMSVGGSWPLKKWLEFAEWMARVSTLLRPRPLCRLHNLFSSLDWRLRYLVRAKEELREEDFAQVLETFVEAYREIDVSPILDPSLQPFANKIWIPRYLRPAVLALKSGNVTDLGAELDFLGRHYFDPTILSCKEACKIGDLDTGMMLAAQAVQNRPENALNHFKHGLLLAKRREYAAAEAAYRRALDLDPELADVCIQLSSLAERRGDRCSAARLAERAIELNPYCPLARVRLGTLLTEKGDLGGALDCHAAAHSMHPYFAPAMLLLSRIEAKRGNLEAALSLACKVLDFDQEQAHCHLHKGALLVQMGDLDRAEAATREAIRLSPADGGARVWLSTVLMRQNKLEEAVAAAREAVAGEPENLEFQYHLGDLCMKAGHLAEAEARFRELIARNCRVATGCCLLSNVLERQGRLEEAIAAAREAAKIEPESANFQHRLGILLSTAGSLDEAETLQRRAIALNGKLAGAHSELSIVLERKGRLQEAIAAAREAATLRPESASLQHRLGILLLKVGELDEAEACQRRAIALNGKLAAPRSQLDAILKRKEALHEARRAGRPDGLQAQPQSAVV